MKPSERYVARFVVWSQLCGVVVFTVGLAVLAGWAFDIPSLKSVLPGLVTMKVNTALGFILSGLALELKAKCGARSGECGRRVANACAAAVTLLGAVTLCEYLFGKDLALDNWLFREGPGAVLTLHPGRMAPNTALSFLLLGVALLIPDVEMRRGRRPAQFLAAGVALVALLAFTGYIYGVSTFYFGVARYTAMALHTTLAFGTLSIGIFLVRPDKGWAALLTGETEAGRLARRLIPVAIGTPLFVGFLAHKAERSGLFDGSFGDAVASLSTVVIVAVVIWRTAASLEREETNRQRSEETLREERHFLAALLDHIGEGIVSCDAQGRIARFNRAARELHGLPEEAILPDRWADHYDLYEADGQTRLLKERIPLFRALQGEVVRDFEMMVTPKHNPPSSVMANSRPLRNTNGAIVGAVAAMHNITERKRVEAQLRQQQKLASISTLARGMAHEINNPIMGVTNYAQIIRDKMAGNALIVEYADGIIAESRRVTAMTHGLLSYSQESDMQAVAPVTLADMVASVLPSATDAARQRGIDLSCDIPSDLRPVSCRRETVGKVVTALLTNATEALDEERAEGDGDKAIRLTVRQFARAGRAWLRLTVEDNGPGIPEDICERVFDPFFTTKDRTRHSGLGLWISRSTIQEHGGDMTVESEAGKWMRVHVVLPVDMRERNMTVSHRDRRLES